MTFRYTPLYNSSSLTLGTGRTVIVTGWTVASRVVKKIEDNSNYAAIGNLYNAARGINYLVRNLLYNPHVNIVIGLNSTLEDNNSGSVQCLRDLFVNGFSKGVDDIGNECWVINSTIPGYIDIEVNKDDLELLINTTLYVDAKSIKCIKNIVESSLDDFSVNRESKKYKENLSLPTTLPTNQIGHRIEGETIAETWIKLLHRITNGGSIRPNSHGSNFQELTNVMSIISKEPDEYYLPEYISLTQDAINSYVHNVTEDNPNGDSVSYTYGQRLRSWFNGVDQIEQVVKKIVNDIDSARAVLTLWDVNDAVNSLSPPCLNHIWVRVVNNRFILTAIFRSHDCYGAWLLNVYALRELQKIILNKILENSNYTLEMGELVIVSQSAHIYESCWDNAKSVVKNNHSKIVKKINYYDPCGNFIINTNTDNKITVNQTHPDTGVVVAVYEGANPLKLLRQIVNANPNIKPDHAGYLGMELGKAANNDKYVQDK